jgi:hypothetical protein
MKTLADYQAFQAGLTVLMDSANGVLVTHHQLAQVLVDYLAEQPWGHCLNREYALQDFRLHLAAHGQGAIAQHVMEWADECANGIRWPVAFTYIVTGKLPGSYRENTTVVIVVEDHKGKIVRHQVLNWCDYSHVEDDADCYRAFNEAIDKAAVDMGARSIFDFHCHDARPTKSVSVAHDPEQGASIFNEREYQ